MTPEQEREFRALLAEVDEENSGWRSVMDPVAAELRSLRAALAASQAREAALTELLRATWKIANLFCRRQLYLADVVEPILAGQSPDAVADALGRVARAGVRAVQAEWEPDRATLDRARIEQRAAVDNLLAVAPHWGEPGKESK